MYPHFAEEEKVVLPACCDRAGLPLCRLSLIMQLRAVALIHVEFMEVSL